jgi:hypothetical protein
MKSIQSILLQALIVVLVPLWVEPVVLNAAPSGIAAREEQTLRPVPKATTRCAPGELLVKWKEGPDSPAATLATPRSGAPCSATFTRLAGSRSSSHAS